MIINRKLSKDFEVNKIRLVYGRRKTGKSFYVENFVKYDKYLFVYRDKSIKDIKTNDNWSYDELKRYLSDNQSKVIVIDEFHRLDSEFSDFLHSKRFNNIILITSSIHIANKLISEKSPILGLVYPIEFSLIKPCEILPLVKGANLLEYSVFLREPALIELFDNKEGFDDFLVKFYNFSKYWSSALFGEIFEDEDRKLTELYEAIVRAISLGKCSFGEITTYLYNNNLIKKDNPGFISAYLDILVKIGVIKKVELYGKTRRYIYKLMSVPIDFFFYIDSKYGSNIGKNELLEAWKNKESFYIEDFVGELLSNYYGCTQIKYSLPDKEIDVVLRKFQKLKVIGSVKWTSIDKVDLVAVKKNLDVDHVSEKFLLVKNKKNKIKTIDGINVYEPSDLIKFCGKPMEM